MHPPSDDLTPEEEKWLRRFANDLKRSASAYDEELEQASRRSEDLGFPMLTGNPSDVDDATIFRLSIYDELVAASWGDTSGTYALCLAAALPITDSTVWIDLAYLPPEHIVSVLTRRAANLNILIP